MWLGAALILTAASAALVATQGLDDAAAAPTDTQKSNTPKMGHPYLDEFGNICQDKMEMMQHVEYEKQIMCKVKMKEHCRDEKYDEDSDGLCHTVNVKKCQTEYKPSTTKVKVRVCPDGAVDLDDESKHKMQDNSVVIDVRPTPVPKFVRQAKCVNGKRAMCVTKYETMCTNHEVEYEMMEDHPRCRVELIEKCEEPKRHSRGGNDILSRMMHMHKRGKTSRSECRKFPAMRCKIEKMKVMKKKPETKCERMPRQFCRKEECGGSNDDPDLTSVTSIMDESLCYFRIQMVNEILPKRTCNYTPKRVCHSTSKSGQLTSSNQPRDWLQQQSNEEKSYMAKTSADRDHRVRMSRKFFNGQPKRVCQKIPEQECRTMRVNPKPVMREMKKKVCRKAQPEVSSYDRSLVEQLQAWAKVSVGSDQPPSTAP